MTTSSVQIRVATSADAELLADLGARTLRDTFGPDQSSAQTHFLTLAFTPDGKSNDLADPQAKFLIAEVDGEAAAYAKLRFGYSPPFLGASSPMEIARFYTDSPWVGRGVANVLMDGCLRVAADADCDVIWLDVWERNHRAIAFYEKWGFATAGSEALGWTTMARSACHPVACQPDVDETPPPAHTES